MDATTSVCPSTDHDRLLLRPREAARMLGVSEKTLWQHTAPRGEIVAIRIGGKLLRYPVDQLQAYIRGQIELAQAS